VDVRPELVLASRSPQRRHLLEEAGIGFRRGPFPDIEEELRADLEPAAAVRLLAEQKARAVMPRVPSAVVLAADTVIVLEGEVLGKPRDAADAGRMLRRLSGRAHEVATGVAVGQGERLESGVDVSRVAFRVLTEGEIEAYVGTGEPLDKAGSYAIQGGAAAFVDRLEGEVDTVIGLPIGLVRTLLARLLG
jgi:septum formation protein